MFRPGIGVASPSISVSRPAMILSSVDLPEPLVPSTPILAPGKKLSDTSLRIWRLGGTILPTLFMVKTYWAIGIYFGKDEKQCRKTGCRRSVNAIFTGFRQAFLRAGTTRRAWAQTPFGKACFMRESPIIVAVRQYRGCWLQLPSTFG